MAHVIRSLKRRAFYTFPIGWGAQVRLLFLSHFGKKGARFAVLSCQRHGIKKIRLYQTVRYELCRLLTEVPLDDIPLYIADQTKAYGRYYIQEISRCANRER